MASRDQNNTSFTFIAALRAAAKGVLFASKERNFRLDACFAVFTVILGLICNISAIEWVAVFICFGLVLGGETINSGIEAIVDLASPDYHALAGKAKDCAAGGALIFAAASFAVGCVIFVPKLLTLIFGG